MAPCARTASHPINRRQRGGQRGLTRSSPPTTGSNHASQQRTTAFCGEKDTPKRGSLMRHRACCHRCGRCVPRQDALVGDGAWLGHEGDAALGDARRCVGVVGSGAGTLEERCQRLGGYVAEVGRYCLRATRLRLYLNPCIRSGTR